MPTRRPCGARHARLRDLPGWPPQWSGLYRGQLDFPQGAVGTLRAAVADADQDAVVLAIELDGDYAAGLLPLPPRLHGPMERLLRTSAGISISAVGTLELEG